MPLLEKRERPPVQGQAFATHAVYLDGVEIGIGPEDECERLYRELEAKPDLCAAWFT